MFKHFSSEFCVILTARFPQSLSLSLPLALTKFLSYVARIFSPPFAESRVYERKLAIC